MTRGSDLCTQCGLCCSGALHEYVALDDSERGDEALVLGLVPGGRTGFTLPCPMLAGCTCSIYQNRPQACRRYKCQQLLELEAGNTTLGVAADRVREATRLNEEVARHLPAGQALPEARNRLLFGKGEGQSSALKLALAALCLYLDKYFKHGGEAKFLSLESTRRPGKSVEMQ